MRDPLHFDLGNEVEDAFHVNFCRREQNIEDLIFQTVVIAVEIVRMQIVPEQLAHQ